MKCLIILSHLMSSEHQLGAESIARSQFAINRFMNDDYAFMITTGWAYRKECSTPIANVLKKYILDNSKISGKFIKTITSSRDTVGDAYYCLEYLSGTSISEIHIVTSDYHVARANLIFNSMFRENYKIVVLSVETDARDDLFKLNHERRSIQAFYNTFRDIDFSSRLSIYEAISLKHPFYNGEIYPKISNV